MLQHQAMLANLNIRSWTARKHDKAVSAEVDTVHNARDGGRYNKLLIAKQALDPLTKQAGRIRDYHYTMTLPWGDNGDRLLPAKQYMEYTAAMRIYKDEITRLTQSFINVYPTLVQDARMRLGSMYDAADYPDASDIRDRFGVNVSFQPVPDAKDFRVDVNNDALEEIRASINATVIERQAGAIKECWMRLYEVVSKLEATMVKDKPIFRDSLIENVADLIAMLPKLNITNDKELNEICRDIQAALIVEPDSLRHSASSRESLALKASTILDRIVAKTK
jgi:hypothetical protein